MFVHQRRALGNETTPMDEPFLTGANTSGETLEQMRAPAHINNYLGSVHAKPGEFENAAFYFYG